MKKLLNSKPLYVILLILASIILVFTLLIRLTVSGNMASGSNRPNGGNFSPSQTDGGSKPSFDESSMPSFSGDGSNMPSFDGSNMPSFSGDGSSKPSFDGSNMPSFSGDGSSMPSFDGSNMPSFSEDGSGMPSMPGGNQSFNPTQSGNGQTKANGLMKFVMIIRKGWIIISLLCVAVIVLCIVRLIMISKKNHKAKEIEEEKKLEGKTQDEILQIKMKEEADLAVQNRKQKKTKNIILAGVLTVVIVFVSVVGKMMSTQSVISINSQVNEEVLSSNVEASDIATTLKGAGTIAENESSGVSLPGSIKIATWLVSNGDSVSQGDVIAEIDTDSVASAIVDLQALIADLDADLELAKADTISEVITSTASGRVIQILAKEGDTVSELVGTSGAIMRISLDGALSVTLPHSDDVVVGTEVSVTVSDGSELRGKVVSKNQSEMVVTVSDENTILGDEVTVTTEDGTKLGSGKLNIHSELKITGFTGTVDTIHVAEGELVEAGDELVTLSDAEYSIIYEELLDKRETLVEQMRTLILAYASGYLYAEEDGVISGIDVTDVTISSADSVAVSSLANNQTSSNQEDGSKGVVLTKKSVKKSIQISRNQESQSTEDGANSISFEDNQSELPAPVPEDMQDGAQESTADVSIDDQTEDSEDTTEEESEKETDNTVEDEIEDETEDETEDDANDEIKDETGEASELTSLRNLLIEKIGSMDYETLIKVFELLKSLENGGNVDPSGNQPSGNQPSGEQPSGNQPSGEQPSGNQPSGEQPSGNQPSGDYPSSNQPSGEQLSGNQPSGDYPSGNQPTGGYPTGDQPSSNQPSGAWTGGQGVSGEGFDGGVTNPTGTTEEIDENEVTIDVSKYVLSDTTFCSITPDLEVCIDITVDEMDIGYINAGKTVHIALDAFPGRSFEGTISEIAKEGSNDGGNTKYNVMVVMSSEENILVGMNASVIISKEEKSDVLTIPLNAVYEEGSKAFVYTSYDEKKDELGDPVEVELGLSDGEYAEIVSGLVAGDSYYYRYAGTITYNFLSKLTK